MIKNQIEKKNYSMVQTPSFSKKNFVFLIFIITYLTYASLHASRTAWSYGKHDLERDSNYSNRIDSYFFGTVDMIFMLFYGIGLFVSGYIGDKFSLKKMLVFGMSFSTFFYFLIFLTRVAGSKNEKSIIAFMCFNGLFQSTGFPACVTILGNWIDKKSKGRVFGIWSSCHNIGNIIGTIFGLISVDSSSIGWEYAILFGSLFMFINTLLIGFFVVSSPKIAGFPDEPIKQQNPSFGIENQDKIKTEEKIDNEDDVENKDIKSSNENIKVNKEEENNNNKNKEELVSQKTNNNEQLPIQKSLNPLMVCLIPGVFFYSILNVCIKILVVSLLLWLPIYLKDQKLDHHAGNIALLFEFGQIIGAFGLGYFCDRINKRAALIMPVLLINVIVFIIVANLKGKDDLFSYYLCLFLIGIFLGGPSNLIAAMISQDISHNKDIKKRNKKIASTLVGIIDGSGYIGVAITQKLIPYFLGDFFLVMILFLCFASIWISPKALFELINVKNTKENEIKNNKNELENNIAQKEKKLEVENKNL